MLIAFLSFEIIINKYKKFKLYDILKLPNNDLEIEVIYFKKFYNKAIKLNPNYLNAYINLFSVYNKIDNFVESEKLALYLIEFIPADLEVRFALAQIQRAQGKYNSAIESFECVAIRKSDNKIKALIAIVTLCLELKLYEKGLKAARKRIKLEPKSALAHYQLALLWWNLNDYYQALTHVERAVLFEPDNAAYNLLLSEILAFSGDINGALAKFEHTKRLAPDNKIIYKKKLMIQNYSDELSDEEIFRCHVEYGKRLEAHFTKLESFPVKKINRKIRVAYVSTDFRRHSVSYFFLPIAKGYDRNKFDLYCYADMPLKDADDVTEQLKGCSTVWRDVDVLTDEQLYTQIRADDIDILVDLAGYGGTKSRMPVFAKKAAPVQVTYLAYPNTTGLTRMDYRVVDEFTDPVDLAEAQCTEELVRLKSSFLCFEPEDISPSIEALPVDNTDIFTFGSFNNYLKITDNIIDAWSKILSQVPNSKLYVKAAVFADLSLQNHFAERCKSAGIARKRLLLDGQTKERLSHLTKYQKVDLHLDTFPYNGTTTTLEAMWMGVPTVTLAGGSHRSRVGCSIMSNLNLADYIAQSKDEYVDIAVSKANDLGSLRAVRAGSRQRVSESAIMDNQGFLKELEEFYSRSMAKQLSK
mgnify:CR=1 FL=1